VHIPILVVTAKPIGADDRQALDHEPGGPIRIVDKAGFDRTSFLAEVRRAMPPVSARVEAG
jgi:hypothetical protein